MRADLQKLLMEYCDIKPDNIQEKEISDCNISSSQLRDMLYLLGTILYEDLEHQIYVASIRSGIANMNQAVVVMQLHEAQLLLIGYAKEGLIKQNLCEVAFQKIQDAVDGKPSRVTCRHRPIIAIVLAAVGVAAFISIRGCVFNKADTNKLDDSLHSLPTAPGITETQESTEITEDPAFNREVELTVEATKKYNLEVKQFNSRVDEYNHAVSLVCVDNIKGLPVKLEKLALESETYEDNAAVVLGDYNKEKIAADIETIHKMTLQTETLLKMIHQIHSPDGELVYEKLNQIEGITGCQQVTKALNPDGLLGKEGGYSACIYFTHALIDQKTIPGTSIVAKGTDAGGAVEVYPNLADAQARVEYLSGFDNTILYSGSYAILGTMVIRTSYKLSNRQQFLLTDAITRALITVEDTSE